MKKVYLIYVKIPTYIYLDRLCHLVTNNDFRFRQKGKYILGLYAWTDDKKLLKEFMETRYAPIFKVKKTRKDNLEDILPKDISITLKLEEHNYFHDSDFDPEFSNVDDTISDIVKSRSELIVSTREEYNNCAWSLSENMLEYGPAKYIVRENDYTIFNDELIDALDILGYISNYDLLYANASNMYDVNDYNRSFGTSYRGHNITNNILCNMHNNQYYGFIYLYSYLIFGEQL